MENPSWRQVVASILGVSFLGVIGYLGGARTKAPAPSEAPPKKIQAISEPVKQPAPEASAEQKEPKKIVLDIGGAIAHPGVYWLWEGGRLDELVSLAGGLLPNADRERINMALVLKDGVKVTIPYKREAGQAAQQDQPLLENPELTETASDAPPVAAEPKVVNINLATKEELQALPSIGEELASRIVKYREGIGGFKSVDELKQVRGIGNKLFEKVRAYLTL